MLERASFTEQLKAKWDEGKFVCVGLDPDWDKLPPSAKGTLDPRNRYRGVTNFLTGIVDSTGDLVCAFKPNSAFFEDTQQNEEPLATIVQHIRTNFPDVPIIGDIKRGDIGNTNRGYARMAFDRYNFDAITVQPYLGSDTFPPFSSYEGRGLFVLCKTTNPGSKELQDMPIDLDIARRLELISEQEMDVLNTDLLTVSEMVAFFASQRWNQSGNLGLVVGATHPEAFAPIRKLAPDLPFLIPGIGTQGGDLEETLKYAPDSKGQGMIISSSSGILYASSGEDFAQAARVATLKLHNQITELRAKNG